MSYVSIECRCCPSDGRLVVVSNSSLSGCGSTRLVSNIRLVVAVIVVVGGWVVGCMSEQLTDVAEEAVTRGVWL